MSGEDKKTHEVPSASVLPTTPPKRFLGSSSYLSTSKKPASLCISPSQSTPSPCLKQQPSPTQSATPPKLIHFPSVVLTPVNLTKLLEKSTSANSTAPLPPPPPLIKMPITTRKDKKSTVVEPPGVDESEKTQEPPKKRTRVAEKSGESSRAESTTPRKIIQEIFGPDKSKRPKGKGRKKRRGGATTPKKKILAAGSSKTQNEVEEKTEGDQEEEECHEEDEAVSQQGEDEAIETLETSEKTNETELKDDDTEELSVDTDQISKAEKNEVEENESADKEKDEIDRTEGEDETSSVTSSSSRRVSKRKAKAVANQRLKRLSQCDEGEAEGGRQETTEEAKGKVDSETALKEECEAASVQSRRSTTEGSSKSGGSYAQQDSESSAAGYGNSANNANMLEFSRQNYNPTPYSNISDDDDDGKDEGADIVSVSDIQEHKDSDVDSTYSWKPVRAAAAAALEQVTKNQGGGSTGLPGDAEAKAAAAAERRARKINRYKGRNRRTLMFKSSSSKKYTAVRNNRYLAQPTILHKIFHHGHYFQTGDIVSVELTDGTPMHGQIRGLMIDHFGEISAGLRFLAPKHPIYAFMEFEPINYAFRYDMPERLIKIEYINFVMHSNLDYFDGHPSFSKIEKSSMYMRMGKSLQNSYEKDSSSDSNGNSSSESGDEREKNGKKDEGRSTGRRRHISDSSTDNEENDKAKTQKDLADNDVEKKDITTDNETVTKPQVNVK